MEDYTNPGKSEEEKPDLKFNDAGKMPDPMLTIKGEETTGSAISFDIYGHNYLKITHEGFFVEGRLVVEDLEIYDAFKNWLDKAQKDLDEQNL
jgi:hypothetical protein